VVLLAIAQNQLINELKAATIGSQFGDPEARLLPGARRSQEER
jgi:hypothetical protein